MKRKLPDGSYSIINLVFSGIIIAIIAYSIVFNTTGRHYPIPSGSYIVTGKPSLSTGLSRSFSSVVRFDFEKANNYNPYGIRIFLFFFIQLILRITSLLLLFNVPDVKRKVLQFCDIVVTTVLFLVAFWPFLASLFKFQLN